MTNRFLLDPRRMMTSYGTGPLACGPIVDDDSREENQPAGWGPMVPNGMKPGGTSGGQQLPQAH
ncbi:MAG: hypothetical protein GY888_17360 [Planctomycetaceae bacterium]|nr:hypothetical protein [Planctomycetaceae bacterium]